MNCGGDGDGDGDGEGEGEMPERYTHRQTVNVKKSTAFDAYILARALYFHTYHMLPCSYTRAL